MNDHQEVDYCVIGSGFGGSLLAWILASQGRRVALLDRGRHPRFAIGESSTPLADLLLEQLAERYRLDRLAPLSRWGTWRQSYPDLGVGKKRGFSYFAHQVGRPFYETQRHENSLLVAASATDRLSDTHWLRSDVDAWFCQNAVKAGVQLCEGFQLEAITRKGDRWLVTGTTEQTPSGRDGEKQTIDCGFVIDASGAGGALASALDLIRLDDRLQTSTSAVFGHFAGVGSMTQELSRQGIDVADDPFDADDAAQHHLVEGGWLWMLRFASGITSVGLVRDAVGASPSSQSHNQILESTVARYPSLQTLMDSAQLVAPSHSGRPALVCIPRISRLWARCAGANWAMLPGSAGIVDPLHSTGMSHTLSGVARLAEILLSDDSAQARATQLAAYSTAITGEILWVDSLVSVCYTAARCSFETFRYACCLYFFAAISCERSLARRGLMKAGFLAQQDDRLRQKVEAVQRRLATMEHSAAQQRKYSQWLRTELAELDDVGLLDVANNNRIAHSVAPK